MIRSTFKSVCCLSLGAVLAFASAEGVRAGQDQPPPIPSNEPMTAAAAHSDGTDADRRPVQSDASPAALALPPRSATRQSVSQPGEGKWITVPSGTWRTIGSLALIIGLIVALRSLMTRFGGPLAKARAPSGIIEVLGRFPLSRGQTLVLLKVDRRVLVLSQAAGSLTTLSEITDAEQVASLLQRIRHERGDSFTRQFEKLITPVTQRAEAGPYSSAETPVIVDLTRTTRQTPAQRIASLFADGGKQ